MDGHLSRSDYVALLRAIKPRCSGCLDMNPSIFDWRAVQWASSYPSLDPQKIVSGAKNQCMPCTMIEAAFHTVGLDLHTAHDIQRLSLFTMSQNGSLLALAAIQGRTRVVEFYTAHSELLSCCVDVC
jgi:hypothetical protein